MLPKSRHASTASFPLLCRLTACEDILVVSTAINAGVDSQIVAKASNHKDVNSVKKYFDADQFAATCASIACSTAAIQANNKTGDDTTEEVEQDGGNDNGRRYHCDQFLMLQ